MQTGETPSLGGGDQTSIELNVPRESKKPKNKKAHQNKRFSLPGEPKVEKESMKVAQAKERRNSFSKEQPPILKASTPLRSSQDLPPPLEEVTARVQKAKRRKDRLSSGDSEEESRIKKESEKVVQARERSRSLSEDKRPKLKASTHLRSSQDLPPPLEEESAKIQKAKERKDRSSSETAKKGGSLIIPKATSPGISKGQSLIYKTSQSHQTTKTRKGSKLKKEKEKVKKGRDKESETGKPPLTRPVRASSFSLHLPPLPSFANFKSGSLFSSREPGQPKNEQKETPKTDRPGRRKKKGEAKARKKEKGKAGKEKGAEESERKRIDDLGSFEILENWNQRRSRKRSFGKKEAEQFHAEIHLVIENGPALNIGEIIEFRLSLQQKCANQNLIEFYEENPKSNQEFLLLQNALFQIQESKVCDVVNKIALAKGGLDENMEKVLEMLAENNSPNVMEQYCQKKRQFLIDSVLSCPKEKYQNLVEKVATELNERALNICKSIDVSKGHLVGHTELARNSDCISYFVLNTLLFLGDERIRATMFAFFQDVAEHMYKIKGDHYGAKAIVGMLSDNLIERTLLITDQRKSPSLSDIQNERHRSLTRLLGGSNFGIEELKILSNKQKVLPTFIPNFTKILQQAAFVGEREWLYLVDKQAAEEKARKELEAKGPKSDTEEPKKDTEESEEKESQPKKESYSLEKADEERNKNMEILLLVAEHARARPPCSPGIFVDLISLEISDIIKNDLRSRALATKMKKKYGIKG